MEVTTTPKIETTTLAGVETTIPPDYCIVESVVCENSGTCENIVGGWNCLCVEHVTGRNCESGKL